MTWPYPFTVAEVMRRGAEVARRYALEEKQLRRRRKQKFCGYCGGTVPCRNHSDLP